MVRKSTPWRKLAELKVYLVTILILGVSVPVYIKTCASQDPYLKIVNVLAAGLVPAAFVGLLWELFVRKEFLEYVGERIPELASCGDLFGILRIFPDRDASDLLRRIKDARRRIWILVTSFDYPTSAAGMMDTIIQKANRGCQVRILGLAPDSDASRMRSAFSPRYRTLNREIPICIEKLKDRCRAAPEINWEFRNVVRLYDKIPTCACFFVDSLVYVCPLLCNRRGRESVHFLVTEIKPNGEPSKLFEEYKGHFEELWKHSRALDTV